MHVHATLYIFMHVFCAEDNFKILIWNKQSKQMTNLFFKTQEDMS